jgi:hypothetical protein
MLISWQPWAVVPWTTAVSALPGLRADSVEPRLVDRGQRWLGVDARPCKTPQPGATACRTAGLAASAAFGWLVVAPVDAGVDFVVVQLLLRPGGACD